jgi:error-prone DNA polymerase
MQLRNQPRHLSQHPGGFVIAKEDVALLVPVENAAMDNRTVIQWDKDDLDVLKLLKVDILALGMLSALRRGLLFVDAKMRQMMPGPGPAPPTWRPDGDPAQDRAAGRSGNGGTLIELTSNAFSSAGAEASHGVVAQASGQISDVSLQDIPVECKAVYDMLSTGDSVGVFQVESRAQMSMLPRLRPLKFALLNFKWVAGRED